MPTLTLVWGLLAFIGAVVALLPPLRPLNWIILPLAGLGVPLNLYVILARKTRGDPLGIAGLVASGIALLIAVLRVTVGGS